MLIKINQNNYVYSHPLFKNIIPSEILILDYKFRIRNDIIVPIKFLDKIYFVNKNSFIQNNIYLANKIRKYVSDLLHNFKTITCIGGEAYLYGLYKNMIITNYTNNKFIFEDSNKYNISNNLVNYETYIKYKESDILLINLSKLIKNLVNIVNLLNFNLIIVISCHHDDFWKKIRLLNRYKLISRKQFIDTKIGNFITVNILNLK